MKEKTYFGLSVFGNNERYILQSDIEKLPFFSFWEESVRGTTCILLDKDSGVFLHDWESFCKLFIETVRHRLMN
jgi:hypothetical protein